MKNARDAAERELEVIEKKLFEVEDELATERETHEAQFGRIAELRAKLDEKNELAKESADEIKVLRRTINIALEDRNMLAARLRLIYEILSEIPCTKGGGDDATKVA
jgi:chromosome segregation ATPase